MSKLAVSHWGPRSVWLTVLLAAVLLPAIGQSTALADCKRAFYRGDYALAVQLAETHLRKYPRDAPVRLILARAELAQGKFQRTFEELKTILASEPKNVDALYYLSVVSREMSEREYQRLFSLAPDSARVHQLLAEAALAAENSSEAEAEFQKALEAGSHAAEVATELAELKRSQSKFDEAIHYYLQAEKGTPLNYDIAYGLGACYTYKQEYSRAIEWLQKAVALAPDSAAGRFALGNALFQDGQAESAIPELNHALRFEPRMKQAYFLLGRAYSRLGRQEKAEEAIRKLEELNRSDTPGEAKDPADNKIRKPGLRK
jgi:tetratricopeptide (TPR) repeat protein